VGHGDLQVRRNIHTRRQIEGREVYEGEERGLDEGKKRFFKLFQESTFEGSRAAAQKMKEYAKRQTKQDQTFLLFYSSRLLIRSKSEMLSWPNSPLLVMLQFVDPNVKDGDEEMSMTPLHHLADLADPFDYSAHENQLILAKQLIDHGANVITGSIPRGVMPLHKACQSATVTNLDFVELLLEKGADPNAQDRLGCTPLMFTTSHAPGAAKFLLNWPTTDANITERSGASFLDRVRLTITTLSDKVALPDNIYQVQDQFQLQQWREIEVMLVERGAAGSGTTTLE
jgi:CRISPR/Cas system-associated endoribonuclease Cas2